MLDQLLTIYQIDLRKYKQWNANGPNFYSLEYVSANSTPDSERTMEVEISKRFSTEVQINIFQPQTKSEISFRIKTGSYINIDHFSSEGHTSESSNTLDDVYISVDDIKALFALLDVEILENLSSTKTSSSSNPQKPLNTLPTRILRESIDRPAADSSPSPASRGPGSPYGTPPPTTDLPRRGLDFPPDFDDELEVHGKLRMPVHDPSGLGAGIRPPVIGERDLHPPGLGPIGGISGGGMFPTLEELQRQGGRGRRGNDDDDPLNRPPGSRWDPLGPGSGQGFGGGFGGPSGGFL